RCARPMTSGYAPTRSMPARSVRQRDRLDREFSLLRAADMSTRALTYRHRQTGYAIMIAMIIAAIIMDVAFIAAGIPALSIISLVVLAIAFVFSSLTVE